MPRGSQWKTPEEEAKIRAEKEARRQRMVYASELKQQNRKRNEEIEAIANTPLPATPSNFTKASLKEHIISLLEHPGSDIYPTLEDAISTLPFDEYKACQDYRIFEDEECLYAIKRRLSKQAVEWRVQLTDPEGGKALQGLKFLLQAYAMTDETLKKVATAYKTEKKAEDDKAIEIEVI